jgi:hypothetical protein
MESVPTTAKPVGDGVENKLRRAGLSDRFALC